MKPLVKNILTLAVIEILLLAAGYVVILKLNIILDFSELAILSFVFLLISLITLIIFFRGQGKDPGSQTMHSLVSVSLKFLIEIVLAIVWFIIAKKTGLSSVLLFFVLYLTFTLFSIFVILKTLKNKSL